jgi:hypothetical protein
MEGKGVIMSNEIKQAYVAIMHKCVPAAVWAQNNPVLARGELGIELDTKKFKFGDGVTRWTELDYATRTDISDVNGLTAALESYLAKAKEYTDEDVEEINKVLNEIIASYYTKKETYNKEEIDSKLDAITAGDIELSNYYTKSEVNTALDYKVPTTRKINGKPLNSDITLSASDVSALPNTTEIPNALADLADDSNHRTVTDTEKAAWNNKLDSSGLTHIYPNDSEGTVGLNIGGGVKLLSVRDEGYITLHGQGGATSIGIDAQSIAGIDYTNIITTAHKGVASGVAELDENGKVIASQLPSYVDDVLEGYYNEDEDKFYSVESPNENPYDDDKGKIYVDISTNKTYRYSGTQYVEISASLALGETSSTAYRGDHGKIAYDHS